MVSIGGVSYYVDFNALDVAIKIEDKIGDKGDVNEQEIKEVFGEDDKQVSKIITTKVYPKGKEIDGARYDYVGLMLQIIMNTDTEIDDTLGIDRALDGMPLNWKIAFNTLTKYGILVAIEEE